MAAAEDAAAGPLQAPLQAPPEQPPPKTPRNRTFRGKSVSSRFNLFRDPDPQSSDGSKSLAGARNPPASISLSQASDVPPIPNFVLSANTKNDSSPSLLERRFFGGELKPPPSPSARSFYSESGSPFGSPLSRSISRTEREIDELATQLEAEIEEAHRKKAEALQNCTEEEAARCADDVARLEAERDQVIDEQRKFDLARLQAQPTTPSSGKPKRGLEKLNLFSRSRKPSSSSFIQPPLTPLPPGTPSTVAPTVFTPGVFTPTPSCSRRSSLDDSPLLHSSQRMSFIKPHPDGDAPISAINGGERRVTVRCLSSTISLDVTAQTTPVDILIATAAQTRHDVDVETSVVVECYDTLGLERRMRRYEHVRDTLNSWDRDQDNSLLVIPSDASDGDENLELESVPQTDDPAPGFTIQLYHSSRPGKWNKRFITLLSTGQVFASKRSDTSISDKDSTSLCHLSDFDIYKPKVSEAKRHLKPPKKLCFAIKSQQKTVVFPNGENFVHFFCTDDAAVAQRFFDQVHAWRSWYIVNKITHSREVEKPAPLNLGFDTIRRPLISEKSPQVSTSGLTISTGSFIDDSDFTKAIEESTRKLALEAQLHKTMSRRRKASGASVTSSVRTAREFSPTGLLGEAYEKRKEEAAAGEHTIDGNVAKAEKVTSPFTEGPSLLNSIGLSSPKSPEQPKIAASWFPSAAEHSARNRSTSISLRRTETAETPAQPEHRKGPAPLLNFGGNYQEPPRTRDGHRDSLREGFRQGPGPRQGHGLRPPPGSPLVKFATSGQPGQQGPPVSPGARNGPPLSGGPPPPPGARDRSRSISSANGGPPNGGSRRYAGPDNLSSTAMQHRGPGPRPGRMPPPSPREAAAHSRDHHRPGPLLQERQERPRERPRERPQERRTGPLVNHAR
ncbi:hypothetical protein M441DRAFT_67675 [Trichoderma asperellum CBS 433.97]|uniref:PH domain-containing protein n=1 Tax=Trichoderma asperellum (strain ATCC 204424 / CBS 433.97 / NBRC 101777) TaxID=1042311 RepID=A0A2T3ZBE7_TRIA4|nr:hypothetical protein M441DRAFT_67675 [Trichoderma asperellum CBS 433.97]PTB42127.1 hypothetical protein M441DRAFT_67675 [Trichoderma asperellum CBS 433.97]